LDVIRNRGAPLNKIITPSLIATSLDVATAADDPLIGTYISETRENFGSDDPGEFKIIITKPSEKYLFSLFHKEVSKGSIEAIPCDIEEEDYLSNRAPGRALALCVQDGHELSPLFSYAENGITVTRPYKKKYYARVGWAIRGFKKIT
jgi:hypothetical protein